MPDRETSAAVTVLLPPVRKVTLNEAMPLVKEAPGERTALGSEEVIWTVSLVLRGFQAASTAFTVTLKATPAVRAAGVPVFPVIVPGALDSPGSSTAS